MKNETPNGPTRWACEALRLMRGAEAEMGGERRSVGAWVDRYRNEVARRRRWPEIRKFAWFAAALLQRQMPGERFFRRAEAFTDAFRRRSDVNAKTVRRLLRGLGYRWGAAEGARIVLAARTVAASPAFDWSDYVSRAEAEAETGFCGDPFLAIKGVGRKVRDFALSLFSESYCAVDVHLRRVLRRVFGLEGRDYRTAERFVRRTAAACGLTPGAVDRTLWHFGRGVCGATPRCGECPLAERCGSVAGGSD